MKKDALSEEHDELQILHDIAVQLNGAVDLQKALELTLQRTVALMNMQTGWVWLLHPATNSVFLAASHNLPPALSKHPERLSGWCYCIDKYLANHLEAASNISEINCTRLKDLTEGTGGLIYHASVPLFDKEQKIGLLNIVSEAKGQLTERQLQVLHTIGQILSVSIARARIFEQSKKSGILEERQRLTQQLENNLPQLIDGLQTKMKALQSKENNNIHTKQFQELQSLIQNLDNYSQQTLSDLKQNAHSNFPETPFQYPRTLISNREMEVLELLKQGKTNKAIAAELFITERTVKFHVSTLLQKLDARNRTDAVQIAVKQGIISF